MIANPRFFLFVLLAICQLSVILAQIATSVGTPPTKVAVPVVGATVEVHTVSMSGYSELKTETHMSTSPQEKVTGLLKVATITVTLPDDVALSFIRDEGDESSSRSSNDLPNQLHHADYNNIRASSVGAVRLVCGRHVFDSHPSLGSSSPFLVPAELTSLYIAEHPVLAALLPSIISCSSTPASSASRAPNQLAYSLILSHSSPSAAAVQVISEALLSTCSLHILPLHKQTFTPPAAITIPSLPTTLSPSSTTAPLSLQATRTASGWQLAGVLPLSSLPLAYLPKHRATLRQQARACWGGSAAAPAAQALALSRAASVLAMHAAPHTTAFLETAMTIGAGAQALGQARVGSMLGMRTGTGLGAGLNLGAGVGSDLEGVITGQLGPAVEPIVEPLGNSIGTDIVGTLLKAIRRHITEGVSQSLGDVLEPMLRGEVTLGVLPAVVERVTGAVTEHVSAAVAESVSNTVSQPIIDGVDERLKYLLLPRLTEHIITGVSAGIVKQASRALTLTVPKALSHSLVPALASTMTLSPFSHQHCYKCTVESDEEACKNCPHDKRNNELWGMAPSTYYSLYYTGYYSNYYAPYYSDRFVEKKPVRFVKRREVDANDPIPELAWHVPDGMGQI